jgi:phospholipid/cholesterol/gamma-HCH transport system substrate-binding protein
VKGRTALQIRRYGRSFLIVIAMIIVGCIAGGYILGQERLANPFAHFYKINAAFPTAAAVVPGLGEPVDVAGVHVGEITGVKLHAGQGVVEMEIDPGKGVSHLFKNAYAVLTPTTPLKDMYVDISPGNPKDPALPSGSTISVQDTTSPIDSDELTDELDVDTRDWFTSLITSLNNGVSGRGEDIKQFFKLLGPTAQQSRTISDLIDHRRTELALLVHNVGQLSKGIAVDDKQLGQLIDTSDTTVRALASQDAQLSTSLSELPANLNLTQATLAHITTFADQLTPTSKALLPLTRHVPTTLRDTRTLVRAAALLPVDKVHSFEQVMLPLAKDLSNVETGLARDTPNLTKSFKGLQYITNELAYDPGGGNPGFLYWLAWFSHNVDSFVGNSDANGPAWRLLLTANCSTLSDASGLTKTVLTGLLDDLGCT